MWLAHFCLTQFQLGSTTDSPIVIDSSDHDSSDTSDSASEICTALSSSSSETDAKMRIKRYAFH